MLESDDRRRLIELYEQRLEEKGVSVQTVGWRSRRQQEVRFQVLLEIGSMAGREVLDVGCGLGDLVDSLSRLQAAGYTGIDLAGALIEEARRLHADSASPPRIDFRQGDLGEDLAIHHWVLASGIFAFPVRDPQRYLRRTVKRMYDLCHLGVAFNCISSYVDYQDDSLVYHDPREVLALAKSLSGRVLLRHDYMPFEFTVYIYKEEQADEENIFRSYRPASLQSQLGDRHE
ncbi:MAG TPA: class I SAM-dependent methyltransferase [Acidobacteriota bacterium]|nr:class I SAM-dependent methyltransferase [Acidobacteriota bacterium]